jgi:hypothetical protein
MTINDGPKRLETSKTRPTIVWAYEAIYVGGIKSLKNKTQDHVYFFQPGYMQIIVYPETKLRNFTNIFKFREHS